MKMASAWPAISAAAALSPASSISVVGGPVMLLAPSSFMASACVPDPAIPIASRWPRSSDSRSTGSGAR